MKRRPAFIPLIDLRLGSQWHTRVGRRVPSPPLIGRERKMRQLLWLSAASEHFGGQGVKISSLATLCFYSETPQKHGGKVKSTRLCVMLQVWRGYTRDGTRKQRAFWLFTDFEIIRFRQKVTSLKCNTGKNNKIRLSGDSCLLCTNGTLCLFFSRFHPFCCHKVVKKYNNWLNLIPKRNEISVRQWLNQKHPG